MSNSFSLHQQQFFNQTCERVFFCDRDGKLTWANPSFVGDVSSDNVSDLMGATLAEIEMEEGIADILGEVEEAVYENHESQKRSQLPAAMGNSNVAVSVECHPVHCERGVFEGVVFQYRVEDANKELEYEKILLDNLMKDSQDLIYFKDRDSKFTRVSDSMIKRLGVEKIEDILGKSDFDFWEQECAEGFFNDEQTIIGGRSAADVRFVFRAWRDLARRRFRKRAN